MSERQTDRVRRIVVGVDGSAASLRAISWAARRAAEIDGEVIAVHAIQPFWMIDGIANSEDMALAYKNWQEDMERVLEEQWCVPLRTTGVAYRSFSVEGGPAALLGVANREQAELVVVGRSGRSGLSELLLGSFSLHVVHHSSVPIVVIPAESEG
ncbi:MAG: universal stress protein [Actinomycetota bacterium]